LKKGGPNNIGDYNLVGNPYPSAIDFDAFYNDNSSAIEGNYSLWTNCAGLDANGHHQNSGYTTYAVSGTSTAACSGSATAGRYIATAQGFMLPAKSDGATVYFKNSQRVTGNNDNFLNRPNNNDRDVVWINMTDNTGKFSQTAVGFYNGATGLYDSMFDAKNQNTGSGFTLYSLLDNDKLSIQGLERTAQINKTIALGFESDANRAITLHIERLTGFDNIDIYLKDNYLNTIHDLKASDYTVNVSSGTIEDRFELIFESVLSNDEISFETNRVLLWQQASDFILKTTDNQHITAVKIYDISGKLLFDKSQLNTATYQVNLQNVAKGNMLLFRIVLDNDKLVVKKAIKR
jgi:hypothetical protein